jgi:hypothetical protein
MKGLSIFFDRKQIRMHPNAYTDHGFGRAVEPFKILEPTLSDEAFLKEIQDLLKKSKSSVPFKMVTKEEAEAYLKAFGVRSNNQMGIGVHLSTTDDQYTVTPINKQGLFGNPKVVAPDALLDTVKNLLKLPKQEIA